MTKLNALFIVFMVISILIIVVLISSYNKKRKYRKVIRELIKDHNIVMPSIKTDTSYGWPTITVIFRNKKDWELAANKDIDGLLKEKIKAINKRVKGFDPDFAVYFKYYDT